MGSTIEEEEFGSLTDVGTQQYEGNEVEISTGEERRFVPGRSRAADTVCLEPGCEFKCTRLPRLRDHIASVHNFPQPVQTFQFHTEEDFRQWLSKIEDENQCSYMRRRGWQKNKNNSQTACYYCNRGGMYISNASKKQTKRQGTCKTGVECTSSLKVTMWSPPCYKEQIEVEAYLQHYGHNFELGHTRIRWHDRKVIEKKLKSGISRHKILDEIRGSLDQTSDLNRIHLISLQDIYNIEKKCGIKANRGRYCSESGITAQAWIEAMQQSEDNPVLLIKYQQEAAPEKYKCLGDDDFLLILQTPLQLKMLQKHGPRQFMCIDVTHGNASIDSSPTKEGHDFQLFALQVLIPDENQSKGPYPVAWCVSNRKDREIVKVFFSCVKENLGGLTLAPGYLFVPSAGVMDGNDWFSIWCDIFGAGPRKFISSWHILEEWRLNLQKYAPILYTSAAERGRVMGNLETVIRESSVKHFSRIIDECLTDLKANELTSSFAAYFESSYMSRAELWASAYRTEAASSADAHLNVFHSRLSRHIYHEALKRKQLDILVKTLMKYTRDNVLPKLRDLHKGKSEFHQRTATATIHKCSLGLSLEQVTPVKGEKYKWNVMSMIDTLSEDPSEITTKVAIQHTVMVQPDHVCTARLRCPLRCADCAVCLHQATCTCSSGIKHEEPNALSDDRYMCVHMHQVCRYVHDRHGIRIDDYIAGPSTSRWDHCSASKKLIEYAQFRSELDNMQHPSQQMDVKPDVITTDGSSAIRVQNVQLCPNEPSSQDTEVSPAMLKRAIGSVSKTHPHNVKPKKIIKLNEIASRVVFVPSGVPIKLIAKY